MDSQALISAFLTNLGEVGSRAVETDGRLADALGRVVLDGERAWPALALEPKRFIAYVAARLPTDQPDLAAALDEIHAQDLFLVCACVGRITHAAAAFRAHIRETVVTCVGKIDPSSVLVDEVEQLVLATLLVAEKGQGEPRVAGYTGRGPLVIWVRVAAERAALDLYREQGARMPARAHELAMAAQVAPGEGSELGYLRQYYKKDFEQAFAHALATLTDRERALLRLHVGGKLALPEIARIYRAPPSVIARWITNARDALAAETEASLKRALHMSPAEFDSVARMLPTQVEARITQLWHGAISPPIGEPR